jgi:predicted CopG family antitoxin
MQESETKKSVGRPKEWTDERISEALSALKKYIEETEIPIIAEFAFNYNIRRQLLYELPEFSDTIKALIEKKEANLERGALTGKINVTMAIFSLKQNGWRDKQEIEHGLNKETSKTFADWIKEETLARRGS